jgi:hypothetical protein
MSIQELVEQSEEERAVEEVEMLLQAYLMNLDNSWNKLEDINEYVEDTEARCNLLPKQLGLCLCSAGWMGQRRIGVAGVHWAGDGHLPEQHHPGAILCICGRFCLSPV